MDSALADATGVAAAGRAPPRTDAAGKPADGAAAKPASTPETKGGSTP